MHSCRPFKIVRKRKENRFSLKVLLNLLSLWQKSLSNSIRTHVRHLKKTTNQALSRTSAYGIQLLCIFKLSSSPVDLKGLMRQRTEIVMKKCQYIYKT